ncbi:sialic acid-binding Ig-like lectin 15 [Acipenser ruthenus]|uniref:sialic acid-binding Ig-like lectin 15 n=1 Tax=Acipenser ruthenus TaxID=7906 RepID=UPI0015605478|nr:sialic acid-binding Ig-like lectin 15 [Acipenser ruthenus]
MDVRMESSVRMKGLLLFLFYSLPLVACKALSAVPWSMTDQLQVNGTKNKPVVIPCIFTHPQQLGYTGRIVVIWRKHNTRDGPVVFNCSTINNTGTGSDGCSVASSDRFSLAGSPKQRNLSLLIKDLHVYDSGLYYCRVELNYDSYQSRHGATLNVPAPAQILQLSLVPDPQSGYSLLCTAEGNPLPSITWITPGGKVTISSYVRRDTTLYQTTGILHMQAVDSYSCVATNKYGNAEEVYNKKETYSTSIIVTCIVFLLLLGMLLGMLFWLKRKGTLKSCGPPLCLRGQRLAPSSSAQGGHNEGTTSDQEVSGIPLYANVIQKTEKQTESQSHCMYTEIEFMREEKGPRSCAVNTEEQGVLYTDIAFRNPQK